MGWTLFRDLKGCVSYVRDVGYRTPNGGWLVESNLNSSPCDVGDLPMTMTMIGGRRGRGGGTMLTADGEDCKYNNERGNNDDDDHSYMLLLFMLE
jgi:hypothetical protein